MADLEPPMDIADCPPGPLGGIKIVDLTTVIFGPYCTQIMGEFSPDAPRSLWSCEHR